MATLIVVAGCLVAAGLLLWLVDRRFDRRKTLAESRFDLRIRSHRTGSLVLLASTHLILGLVGVAAAALFALDPRWILSVTVVFQVIGLLVVIVAWRLGGSRVIRRATRAATVAPMGADRASNIAREVAVAFAIPEPDVVIVPAAERNSCAVVDVDGRGWILLTQGQLASADREALQGIVAHHAARLKMGDGRWSLVLGAMAGYLGVVGDLIGMARLKPTPEERDRRIPGPLFIVAIIGAPLILVLGGDVLRVPILFVAPPLIGWVAQAGADLLTAGFNRERVLLADAMAVEALRNGTALDRAIEVVATRPVVPQPDRFVRHLYFADPGFAPLGYFSEARRSHPTNDVRRRWLAEVVARSRRT